VPENLRRAIIAKILMFKKILKKANNPGSFGLKRPGLCMYGPWNILDKAQHFMLI